MFIVVDFCKPLKRAKPLCEYKITSRPIRRKVGYPNPLVGDRVVCF